MASQRRHDSVLISFVVFALFMMQASGDVCSDVGSGVFPPSKFRACLRSFPFDAKAANQTLQTLRQAVNLYGFQFLTRNTDNKVDISRQLNTIAATKWTTEYDFHNRLYSLFNSLNDGHTYYVAKGFHDVSNTETAYPLFSVVEGGVQKIKVVPNAETFNPVLATSTRKLTGQNVGAYGGAEVVTIDGVPAVQAILAYATNCSYDCVGSMRDISARFAISTSRLSYSRMQMKAPYKSEAIQRMGAFSSRVLLPLKDTMTWTVKRVGSTKIETLVVPWITSYYGPTVRSANEYYNLNCMVQGSQPRTSLTSEEKVNCVRTRSDGGEHGNGQSRRLLAVTNVESGVKVIQDKFVKVFQLPSLVTAVLVIPDEQMAASPKPLEDWMQQVKDAFRVMLKKNMKRVIIDLRSNHGGYLDLAYFLAHYMFPGKSPNYATRIRGSPLYGAMANQALKLAKNNSMMHWSRWAPITDATKPFKSSLGFYSPVQKLKLGDDSVPYSGLFTDVLKRVRKPTAKPLFASKDILILTNGECQSTCALMASALKELWGVKTVAVGGLYKQPMAYANTHGGESATIASLWAEINNLKLATNKDAPRPFTQNIDMGFTTRMAFSFLKPNEPLEFSFQQADFRLPFTTETAFDNNALWKQVEKLF